MPPASLLGAVVSSPRLLAHARGKAGHYGCAVPFLTLGCASLSQAMRSSQTPAAHPPFGRSGSCQRSTGTPGSLSARAATRHLHSCSAPCASLPGSELASATLRPAPRTGWGLPAWPGPRFARNRLGRLRATSARVSPGARRQGRCAPHARHLRLRSFHSHHPLFFRRPRPPGRGPTGDLACARCATVAIRSSSSSLLRIRS